MNLAESLGNLMLRCAEAGTSDITTVASLLQYAADAGYYSSVVLIGADDPPPATPAIVLTAGAAVAKLAESKAIQNDPVLDVPVQELPPSL